MGSETRLSPRAWHSAPLGHSRGPAHTRVQMLQLRTHVWSGESTGAIGFPIVSTTDHKSESIS